MTDNNGNQTSGSAFANLVRCLVGEEAVAAASTFRRHECAFESCGSAGASQICSRCKLAYFCGKECQAAAWKTHKKMCKDQDGRVAELRALLAADSQSEERQETPEEALSQDSLLLALKLAGGRPLAAKVLIVLVKSGMHCGQFGMGESEVAGVLDELFGDGTAKKMHSKQYGGEEGNIRRLEQALGVEKRNDEMRKENTAKSAATDAAMGPIVAACDDILRELLVILPQVTLARNPRSPLSNNGALARHLHQLTRREGKLGWGEVPEFLRFTVGSCESLVTEPFPGIPAEFLDAEGRLTPMIRLRDALKEKAERLWVQYAREFEGQWEEDDATVLEQAKMRAFVATQKAS